jgi:serine/threonine protein kinase
MRGRHNLQHQLEQEVSMMKKIKYHRNIVRFVGASVQHPFCIITEFLPNLSLWHLIHSSSSNNSISSGGGNGSGGRSINPTNKSSHHGSSSSGNSNGGMRELSEALIQSMLMDVCEGMRYLHSLGFATLAHSYTHTHAHSQHPTGLVHCDLKSPNILVSRNLVLKISDLGMLAIAHFAPPSLLHIHTHTHSSVTLRQAWRVSSLERM